MTRLAAVWRIALPGFAAILVGVGFGRFAYTPVLPLMVAEGWMGAPQAAAVAAGNMVGYLLGALSAHALTARFGSVTTLRAALALSLAASLACAVPGGFAWVGFWRFATGIGGALLMVVGAPLVVGAAPPALRGGVSGAVFTGVGLGMGISGFLVPRLAPLGASGAWLGVAALVALAVALAWRGWPVPPAASSPGAAPARLRASAPLLLLAAAYSADAIGFIPHAVFWVDFVARGLGRGVEAGGTQWILFGLGAAVGPMLCGRLADAVGFGRALFLCFLIKIPATGLPLLATQPWALALSSLGVGALVPGIAALTSGAALELLGAAAHPRAWRVLTMVFSVSAAAGGYLFSGLFALSGSYALLFGLGTAIIAFGALCTGLIVRRAARS